MTAAVLAFLGGHLVISPFLSSLPMTVVGFGAGTPALVALLVGQFAFALLVVLAGILVAPASAGAKVVASAVVVAGLVISLVLIAARLSGTLGLPREASFVLDPFFLTLLVIGVAWLIVRRARLGWLALVPVVVTAPVPFLITFAGLEGAFTPLVMFTLSGVIGAGIIVAGRPWRD